MCSNPASGNSADYEMYSQDVTVTAAETEEMAYCLDLALFGDEVVEGTEEFSLTITTASGPVEYESNRNATITLEDNDCENTICLYMLCGSLLL